MIPGVTDSELGEHRWDAPDGGRCEVELCCRGLFLHNILIQKNHQLPTAVLPWGGYWWEARWEPAAPQLAFFRCAIRCCSCIPAAPPVMQRTDDTALCCVWFMSLTGCCSACIQRGGTQAQVHWLSTGPRIRAGQSPPGALSQMQGKGQWESSPAGSGGERTEEVSTPAGHTLIWSGELVNDGEGSEVPAFSRALVLSLDLSDSTCSARYRTMNETGHCISGGGIWVKEEHPCGPGLSVPCSQFSQVGPSKLGPFCEPRTRS